MSSQVSPDELFTKVLWIWISLLISAFAFWGLRYLWLKYHPTQMEKTKYSQRLSKRLRARRALRLRAKSSRKTGHRHWR